MSTPTAPDQHGRAPLPVLGNHPTRKLGVRRVSDEAYAAVMKFGDFRREGVVLPPLVDADYLASIAARLQMLGNDSAGDCEAVRWANNVFLNTSVLTDTPVYPDQDQVWTVYKTQNPSFDPNGTADTNGPGSPQDNGMDSLTLLDYLHSTGGPDGRKVVCYATVDHTNIPEVEAAIDIFGSVWVDIIVLSGNQTQFGNGQPWTDDGSNVEGGHAVLGAGVTVKPTDQTSKFVDIATWAAEASLSENFWNGVAQGYTMVMGVYVVIWPEHLGTKQFMEGVDITKLQEVYGAVTGGKTIPVPVVPPTPQPTPTPTPEPPAPVPTPAPTPEPPTPTPTPTPTPDPGAAPFPGASMEVADRIVQASFRVAADTSDWLNAHFDAYFDLVDDDGLTYATEDQ